MTMDTRQLELIGIRHIEDKMKQFEIGFSYKVEEFGVVTLDAMDIDDAYVAAEDYVKETYPDVTDITVDYAKEII